MATNAERIRQAKIAAGLSPAEPAFSRAWWERNGATIAPDEPPMFTARIWRPVENEGTDGPSYILVNCKFFGPSQVITSN